MKGLLVWIVLGAILRFINLDAKPLWTDEFSTIVFSLGNSFRTIPLNQPVAIATLLQPLQLDPQANFGSVVHHLLAESNHPPLYFGLTHLWLKLFAPTKPPSDSLLWGVRSLSALAGIATIPAVYALATLAFRSTRVGHRAAVLMALSPFGIYLSQEARHYTLAILWIVASLSCLVTAIRRICDRQPLPLWLCLVWIVVNGLGIATHYFVLFALAAEGWAVLVFVVGSLPAKLDGAGLRRIGWVAVGTGVTALLWLPLLVGIQDTELTQWLYRGGDRSGLALLDPIAHLLAGWITMLYLLPIQAANNAVVTISAILLILITLWTIPILFQGLRLHVQQSEARQAIRLLSSFAGGAIALLLGLTYLGGMDLTSAFRYNFIYFPAAIILLAAALSPPPSTSHSPPPILFILTLSLLGSLTVITNLGYQKTHRPDLVAEAIQAQALHPALVVIAHHTHGQTGRLMGVAWELAKTPLLDKTQFLLAHQGQDERGPIRALRRSLRYLPRPLDLWLINVQSVPDQPLQRLLNQQRCVADSDPESVDGYRYQGYRCH